MNPSHATGADPGSTQAGLIAGVQQGDPSAWHQLTAIYGPLVYGWARRVGLHNEDAADITQEVFRSVAARASRFQHGRPGDTFRGWLWTVTHNKLRDFWRQRAVRPQAAGGTDAQDRLLLIAESGSDSRPGLAAETEGLLRRAMELVRAEFEPRSWDAFWRAAVEGHPAADIARELGMTANAVYIARSRILNRLRELLGDDAAEIGGSPR
ncbi:sigma-70 family RNA polymerase sigma factor [Gemmata sp. JC717]|uniref:RNA polymerase sigma factor n=1 Tax=Gemmata algarum TaxID=2975278 RepID=UPI0021BAF068|nr:sigma-70 family RNA polymerase sigma factor [Gemmata algarum]MDY3553729.1 sigma-70 family RNA polymerase sigma factor [Gemmata algarum]